MSDPRYDWSICGWCGCTLTAHDRGADICVIPCRTPGCGCRDYLHGLPRDAERAGRLRCPGPHVAPSVWTPASVACAAALTGLAFSAAGLALHALGALVR